MEIKFDKRNYRKHDTKNKDLIKKSLEECGAGRSIVIDNENNIIAGNGIYSQAQLLGMPTKVVETDGSELVVVKRTDLSTEDDKRKQLAVMDNSTSDTSSFNFDVLKEDFDFGTLDDWGITVDVFSGIEKPIEDVGEEIEENVESNYTIQYNIIFDDEVQQEEWYEFLKYLKNKYPDCDTVAQRLQIFIGKVLNGKE